MPGIDAVRQRLPLLLLLASAAVVFTWQLDVSGFANTYYSAAAQAGAVSWKAFFFGSLDAANGITVDKPPLALWPMGLSVRLFGLSPWSILLPQAIEGVASVGLLYACTKRTTGQTWAAVLAGALFALTPVAVLMFRYNNPDAMLTLLVVASAYATLRALEGRHATRWLLLVGVLAGLGFLTKMFEACLVLPGLWFAYLVYGRATLGHRIWQLLASGAAAVAAAGWWVAIVEGWPADDRPFVGGSPTNSVLQLALGYNGFARLTGSTPTSSASGTWGDTNIAQVGRLDLGGEITWLLPAAVILAVLAWRLSRHHPARDRVRPALVMWTSWFLVASVTFSLMAGIFHSYYTVILAPAIGAVVAIGVWLGWERRDLTSVRRWLAAATATTTLLSAGTVAAIGFELRLWFLVVLGAGLVATVILYPRRNARPLGRAAAVVALTAALSGPALFSWATIKAGHVGSGPMAGPGHAATTTEPVAPGPGVLASSLLGLYAPVPQDLAHRLAAGASAYRWAAATLGSRAAAAYELTLNAPVLAIGGYKGTDPMPNLAQFQTMVQQHQVHWFVPGGTSGPAGFAIETWVRSQFPPTYVDGYTVFDLDSPVARRDPLSPLAHEAIA